jgi:A/G-specific adenine glycosylase
MSAVTRGERIDGFVETLHEWYRTHRRELPWRDLWKLRRDDRAYRVWISEVMLQQTQASRVIGSYKKFIQEFPTVEALGAATNREILVAWRGMGYNSRALRLRDGAKEIATKHGGKFPHAFEDLISIGGIGAYTAGAIRTFAFDLPTPAMDVNIRRILHRVFVGPENADGTWGADDKELMRILDDVIAAWLAAGHRGSDLYSALMDYGSLVQTKNNPKWEICALTEKGIMKATPKNWKPVARGTATEKEKKEPGRYVGTTYVPNRIFRGRIVEALRDHPKGLKFEDIAKWISPDHGQEPEGWLEGLIKKLIQDGMMIQEGGKYFLSR